MVEITGYTKAEMDSLLGEKAAALGADDNYITDAEKAALHSHANKTALDAVSGTNTGDQDLSGLVSKSLVDAKGDLIVATAADTVARLAVGATNGHVLTVDSAETSGLKWAAASGGGALILPNAFPDSIYAFAGGPHSTAGLKLSADKVYLTAYNLAAGAKVRRLVLIVTTAPSQAVTVECGIWSSTAQKVVSATLSISTTGQKEIDLGSVQSLTPDTYWLCTKVLDTSAYGLVLGREYGPQDAITPRGNTWDPPNGLRRGLSGTSSGTGAIATDLSGLTLAMEAASIGYGYRVA